VLAYFGACFIWAASQCSLLSTVLIHEIDKTFFEGADSRNIRIEIRLFRRSVGPTPDAIRV